jgi:hypothetical protein
VSIQGGDNCSPRNSRDGTRQVAVRGRSSLAGDGGFQELALGEVRQEDTRKARGSEVRSSQLMNAAMA